MVTENLPRVAWSESERIEGVELETVTLLGALESAFLSKSS